jgi:MFS family permease
MKESGWLDTHIIFIYVGMNVVYAGAAYFLGHHADHKGFRHVFLRGCLLLLLTYAGLAWNTGIWTILVSFLMYGLYLAATEGVTRGWVSALAQPGTSGSALGLYATVQSIGALIAGLWIGLAWEFWGPRITFALCAGVLSLVLIYFLRTPIVNRISTD